MLGICAVRVKNHYDHFQFPPLAHTESRCPVWWLRTEKSTPPLNKPDVILYALDQIVRSVLSLIMASLIIASLDPVCYIPSAAEDPVC